MATNQENEFVALANEACDQGFQFGAVEDYLLLTMPNDSLEAAVVLERLKAVGPQVARAMAKPNKALAMIGINFEQLHREHGIPPLGPNRENWPRNWKTTWQSMFLDFRNVHGVPGDIARDLTEFKVRVRHSDYWCRTGEGNLLRERDWHLVMPRPGTKLWRDLRVATTSVYFADTTVHVAPGPYTSTKKGGK